MQKKSGIMKSGLDTMPLFLTNESVKTIFLYGHDYTTKMQGLQKAILIFQVVNAQTYQTMNGRVEDCHESIFWTASSKYGLRICIMLNVYV